VDIILTVAWSGISTSGDRHEPAQIVSPPAQ
jgi:hypothetical protein